MVNDWCWFLSNFIISIITCIKKLLGLKVIIGYISTLLVWILFLSILSGCSLKSGQVIKLNDDLLHTYQLPNQCGPNALSIVMRYWNVNKTPTEIATKIYQPSLKGTSSLSMLFYVKESGLEAFLYRGTIEDLRKKINSGYPMLLAIKPKNMPVHYIVAYGYSGDKIIIHNGIRSAVAIGEDELIKIWKEAGYMTLWIHRKGV